MMDTRTVYGYARRMDGTPLVGVVVSIRTFPGVFQVDGSVAPAVILNLLTDAAGRYETSLVANARYLIGIPGDVFDIIVPSGVGSVSVEALRATTGALMTNAVQLAFDAAVAAHALITTAAHGGLVAAGDGRLTNARTPTGSAGGVLSGTYPNPGFAADMATQAELDAALLLKENALGNPDTDGKILSGTVAGGRSWITPPSGGGGGSFTVGAWQALNLENSWVNYDSIFPAYRKITINGIDTYVELRGEIFKTTPTEGETIATVAVGFRMPLAWTRQQFPVYNQIGATAGRIIIRPTGLIQYYAGGSQLDLSAVRFYLV